MNCKYCEELIEDDEYIILVKKERMPEFSHDICQEETVIQKWFDLNIPNYEVQI